MLKKSPLTQSCSGSSLGIIFPRLVVCIFCHKCLSLSLLIGFLITTHRGFSLEQTITFSTPPRLFTDTLTLSLTGASEGQKIRYTVTSPNSTGAIAEAPRMTSTTYTEPIELNSSVIIRAAVFSADDKEMGPVTTGHFLHYTNSGDRRVDIFSSQLPLLVIDSHGLGPMVKDDIDRPGWIYGFAPQDNGKTKLIEGSTFALPLEFAVRGNSSARFPKQSYKMKLRDTNGKKQAIAPFGLGKYDKWQLIGPWNYDRSFIRNAVAYALSNHIALWAPRTRLVEVFINRDSDGLTLVDYAGIYVLTDKIEPNDGRVEIAELDDTDTSAPEVTGGYILKQDWPDEGDYSWTTEHGITMILDTPDLEDVAPEQAAYIENYVQQFEDALFTDYASNFQTRTYLNYINHETWIDYHLLSTLIKSADAFVGSSFFNKDRNGKLSAGPLWDYDRSMGSADPRTLAWDEWRSIEDGDGWGSAWWGKLVRDPDFMQSWIDRWQSLRRDKLSNDSLHSLVNELAGQIGTEAAERDAALYPDNSSQYPGGYSGEIENLKDWLRQRAEWIDEQFVAAPAVSPTGDQVVITPPAGMTLVYTLNGSDPRASGGGRAEGAQTTDAPLILPSSATFRARSRSPSEMEFPATRWSSSVSSTTTGGPPPPKPELPPLKDTMTTPGQAIHFSAGNTSGQIKWQVSKDNGQTWTDLADNDTYSGSSTIELTITSPNETLDGNRYRYVSTLGDSTHTSNAATLTVVSVIFSYPTGITADGEGNLFVSDAQLDAIGLINTAGQVRMITGENNPSGLNRPEGLTILTDGNLAVADTANDVIRRITRTGSVTILAGQAGVRGAADGAASAASFSSPRDVARDNSGTLFVAGAMNHIIRKIAADGTVSTIAGAPSNSGTNDGKGEAARFNLPSAITVDSLGNLYVSDLNNNTIRKITPDGTVSTLAGLPGVSGFADGTGIHALFNHPGGLVVDGEGNLYVADTGNSTIRKVTPDGTVTTIAGSPGIAGVQNGTALNALLNHPRDLTRDSLGNLYVADTGNALIRKITPAGEVSIVTLSRASASDGGGTGSPSTPSSPSTPPPASGGGGGGGGAPSWPFLIGLSILTLPRILRWITRLRIS